MATAPSDLPPVAGRVDAGNRLIAADALLEALQIEAGSALGKPIALPQIAAIVRLAAQLDAPVSRAAVAAAADHDVDMWVRAIPRDGGVDLVIEGWTTRPAAAPRLATILGCAPVAGTLEMEAVSWALDAELRFVDLAPDLAQRLNVSPIEAIGHPLTRFIKLEEDESGGMPILAALAARRAFSGQRVYPRTGESVPLTLKGDVVPGPTGAFAGFEGSFERAAEVDSTPGVRFDEILDEALRSPLDSIVEQAQRIVDQAEGPLRPDYAAYGTDIAAAARHLLSIIDSMNAEPLNVTDDIDLADLAQEAVVMLEAAAEERRVSIHIEASRRLPARGDDRAITQILVNLIGNAIRHSPEGGRVDIGFTRFAGSVGITVEDHGPGIAAADASRIFERFERVSKDEGGTGLGLAISRRLARAMGGDVCLLDGDHAGARFSLTLPTP